MANSELLNKTYQVPENLQKHIGSNISYKNLTKKIWIYHFYFVYVCALLIRYEKKIKKILFFICLYKIIFLPLYR